MADDDATTDETVESPTVDASAGDAPAAPDVAPPAPAAPAVPTTPAAARPSLDRRSAGIGALAVGALVLAFFAGMAISDHDGDGDRFEAMRDGRGGMMQGGGPGGERGGMMQGGGREGGPGMQGGGPGMQGGGPGGGMGGPGGEMGGASGERGGGMLGGRGGHGGAGVVESASDDELTIAPLGGSIEELTVTIDEDTEVKVRGEDGVGDVEDAEVSDIDEGDIVMVMGSPDDAEEGDDEDAATTATITAKTIMILRNGDE